MRKAVFFICSVFICQTMAAQTNSEVLEEVLKNVSAPPKLETPNFDKKKIDNDFLKNVQDYEDPTWNLTNTMTAECSSHWLIVKTKLKSEAMPNFSKENPAPWSSDNSILTFAVRIERGVKTIGDYAFDGCQNLQMIGLPNSVVSIGNNAFQGCTNIETVFVESKKPLSLSNNTFASVDLSNATLFVSKGAVKRYQSANVWKDFGRILEIEIDINIFDEYSDEIESGGLSVIGGGISYLRNRIDEKPITILVLILSVVLFFMRITKRKDEPRQGTAYLVSNTVFLSVCALEILYVIFTEPFDIPWFCDPNRVGWLWTVINFIIMGGVVVNQILYLFDVISDVFENGNAGCDLRWGLYSWVGGLVCLFICGFFFQEGLLFVLLIVGLIQIVQSIFIFRSYKENIKGAFLGISVYLLGTIGTVLTLTTFLVMLIIVVIGGAILWFIMKLMDSDSSSSNSSSSSSSEEEVLNGCLCCNCKDYPGAGYNCVRRRAGDMMVNDNTKACMHYQH